MTGNINLLPEEMKGKEEKAKEAFKKRKAELYEISKPEFKRKKKEKKKKEEKPSPKFSPEESSLQIPIEEKKSAFSFGKHLFHPFKKIKKEEEKEEKSEQEEKEEEKKGEQEEKKKISIEKLEKKEKKPEIPEISLMPEEKVAIPRLIKERILIFIVGLVAIIFLIFIVHLYSLSYFEGLIDEAQIMQGELALKETRIEQLLPQRSKLAQLEEKAKRANNLLEEHIYWTKLFNLLETYTLPGVSWGDFAANTEGTLQLQGSAKDLPTVSQQLVAFSQASDFIKDFTISAVSMGEKAEFTINLELVPGIFQRGLPADEAQPQI